MSLQISVKLAFSTGEGSNLSTGQNQKLSLGKYVQPSGLQTTWNTKAWAPHPKTVLVRALISLKTSANFWSISKSQFFSMDSQTFTYDW